MLPEVFLHNALVPALGFLPAKMDSPPARAMVLAICLQESRLKYRAQIGGPARSYAQFEQGGGVRGVLTHAATKPFIQSVLSALDYAPTADSAVCYEAIEHNDILACAFARLLLYTLPAMLPVQLAPAVGWSQYMAAWKPGRPHRDTWDENFNHAWEIVLASH